MPARPVESRPGAPAILHIQLPADLKNAVVDAARDSGLSVTGWVANILRLAVRDSQGLPPPPPAAGPIPDPAATLRAYVTGERLLGPCGQPWPCDANSATETVGGFEWCRCGIRVG